MLSFISSILQKHTFHQPWVWVGSKACFCSHVFSFQVQRGPGGRGLKEWISPYSNHFPFPSICCKHSICDFVKIIPNPISPFLNFLIPVLYLTLSYRQHVFSFLLNYNVLFPCVYIEVYWHCLTCIDLR